MDQPRCTFPAPPPPKQYCHPAAFASLSGEKYHRLGVDQHGRSAYGTPSMGARRQ